VRLTARDGRVVNDSSDDEPSDGVAATAPVDAEPDAEGVGDDIGPLMPLGRVLRDDGARLEPSAPLLAPVMVPSEEEPGTPGARALGCFGAASLKRFWARMIFFKCSFNRR
jgi:hypothetical protein